MGRYVTNAKNVYYMVIMIFFFFVTFHSAIICTMSYSFMLSLDLHIKNITVIGL